MRFSKYNIPPSSSLKHYIRLQIMILNPEHLYLGNCMGIPLGARGHTYTCTLRYTHTPQMGMGIVMGERINTWGITHQGYTHEF